MTTEPVKHDDKTACANCTVVYCPHWCLTMRNEELISSYIYYFRLDRLLASS